MRSRLAKGGARGFTLLESVVAIAIFTVLGYALALAADMGNTSQAEVLRVVAENRSLREATASIASELRSTSDDNVLIAALPDANHRLRFRMPITVAGVETWGVHDRRLGLTDAQQNREDWFVQYTVRDQAVDGVVEKQLLRQVLDDALVVQREDILARGLRSGGDVPPGFRVVMNGAMWEITLSTDGSLGGAQGQRNVFHVRTRN